MARQRLELRQAPDQHAEARAWRSWRRRRRRRRFGPPEPRDGVPAGMRDDAVRGFFRRRRRLGALDRPAHDEADERLADDEQADDMLDRDEQAADAGPLPWRQAPVAGD